MKVKSHMDEDKKSPEQGEMERQAEERDRKIVRFTNISDKSFTHAFRGVKITVDAGESYTGRFSECEHLAVHLARRIISEAKKKITPRDKGINLFNQKEINEMVVKILTPVGEMPAPAHLSPEEARKQDLNQIGQQFEPELDSKPKAAVKDITKKDVIKELQKRGQDVDVNKSKEELLSQLME